MAEIFGRVFLSEMHDLVVIDVKQSTELTACHCLFERDLPFEAVEDGSPVILIKTAEVNGDGEPDDGRNNIDETVHAFALASSALLAIPGPTVMVVVSYALGEGRSSAWSTVPGVTLGDFTAMTVSVLGAGAILAASAGLFTALKLSGAAYLIWLGIQLWRADPSPEAVTSGKLTAPNRRMFWNAYIVTALNPKSIVFFIAFVPQFVDPTGPLTIQFVILEATFLTLAAVNVAIWALLIEHVRSRFQRPSTLSIVNRIGGSFLIGAGLVTAAVRRVN